MTTYPAYKHGLTIEQRDGNWCVTNDFGGRIIHECDGLEDAIDMRDRTAIGYPVEAVEAVARMDVGRNAIHAAKLSVIEIAGEEPRRIYDTRRAHGVRYAVGDVWGYEADNHVEALESLLHCFREVVRTEDRQAQLFDAVDRALAPLPSLEADVHPIAAE